MSSFKVGDKVRLSDWKSGYIEIEWIGDGCICGQLIEEYASDLCSPRVCSINNSWILYQPPAEKCEIPEIMGDTEQIVADIIDYLHSVEARMKKAGI